jgi:hypothetical protein
VEAAFKPRYARAAILAVAWGVSLGFVGFACGYFGNGLLAASPGSVAPVVGILFTGPIAVAVGMIVGAACGASPLAGRHLVAIFILLLSGTLILSLTSVSPGYEPEAEIIEARVVKCVPVESLIPTRTAYWRSEAARVTRERLVDVSSDWEKSVVRMVSSRPGIVVTLQAGRRSWFTRRRWSWGRTDRRIENSERQQGSDRAFADGTGSDCPNALKLLQQSSNFCMCFEHSERFPPSGLPEFLGLWVAHPIPPNLMTAPKNQELFTWIERTCSENDRRPAG